MKSFVVFVVAVVYFFGLIIFVVAVVVVVVVVDPFHVVRIVVPIIRIWFVVVAIVVISAAAGYRICVGFGFIAACLIRFVADAGFLLGFVFRWCLTAGVAFVESRWLALVAGNTGISIYV